MSMFDGSASVEVRHLRVNAHSAVAVGGADASIVDDVSFTIGRGRVLGLIGESGAGKSTVGLTVLGYGREGCRICAGEVWIGGYEILSLAPGEIRNIRGAKVAYVAQSAAAAFNPAHRIGAQVIEAAVVKRLMTRRQAERRAVELFRQLKLPEPERFGRRFPHQVSGGQLQRAMTAMALLPQPDLIVFDEPTTALDVTTQIEVLAAIKEAIRAEGTTALYISHDLAVVAQVADDIMVLRGGRMVEYGSTRQIIERPREAYTQQLVAVRELRKEESVSEGVPPVLQVDDVTAGYAKGLAALKAVSLSVPKGGILAVVGESGSGKSTLARVVTGLLRPFAGRVLFDRAALPTMLHLRSKEQLRRIQLVYQMPDVALNPRQTISTIVGRPLRFYHGLAGRANDRRAMELLDQVELGKGFLNRYPAELSGGEKQRVCIARALAAEPDLVICDEVTSALDPLVASGILRLLLRLQREMQVSYLFITHNMEIVEAIADSVAVMHRGEVVRYGERASVFRPPFDAYTTLLLSSVPEMRPGWLDAKLHDRRTSAISDNTAGPPN